MILGIKITRRLVSIVGIDDETFGFQESRYVTKQLHTMPTYFARLLEQLRPAAIYYYAPTVPASTTERVVRTLEDCAARLGIPIRPLQKLDVFGSFGILPFRTRADLTNHLLELWPGIGEAKPQRREVLAEATAAALVGDLRRALPHE